MDNFRKFLNISGKFSGSEWHYSHFENSTGTSIDKGDFAKNPHPSKMMMMTTDDNDDHDDDDHNDDDE